MSEEVGHLLVRHVPPREQGKNIVQAHPRKIPALDRAEIRAASFHAQDVDAGSPMVHLDDLHGRVASAAQHQARIRTDQSRLVDQQAELVDFIPC
jgi:hypothetical protein